MLITTMVQLGNGETFSHTADAAAQLVFDALGGDPTTDHCSVSISILPDTGTAGALPDYTPPG
jgi:hypothetical protein